MIRIASPEPASRFAFTGRAVDEEAAVENNQPRHDDPTVGRWLSDEPSGFNADPELYRYPGSPPEY